ncbi:SigB/SigF/SigG family RNA polymerase sigma factor [Nocardia thailandica]|uniref:SigB/SigF/SigG family RNA polymerase sigma factor n=1 Tax=Nocardia thailandica TaxID=257275 RepID=UPI0002DD2AB9|nr:SigB/SigF/SigG family RNA polymerase sigma factor [Nocardia thailandica]
MTARPSHADDTIDGYEQLAPVFTQLAALPPDSREHARLRERIITACLPLAEHIATRYSGRGEPYDDLLQVASLGAVLAVDRYDVTRGVQFLGFAVPTIMGEVRRHFRDTTWALRVTRADKELQAKMGKLADDLAQRLRHSPTVAELAAAANIEPADVVRARVAAEAYTTNSLDAPVVAGAAEAPSILDTLGYDEPCYELTERSLAAAPVVATLNAEERQLLHWRYFTGLSQEEISRRLGVSQMSVSRYLKRLLDRLRRDIGLDDLVAA